MRASGPATAGAEPSPQGEGNPLAGLQRPRRGSSWAKRARPPRRGARRGSSQGYAVDLPPRARERTLRRPGYPLFSFSKFSPRPSPPKAAWAKTKAEREKRLARSNSPILRQTLPVKALRHERLVLCPLEALYCGLPIRIIVRIHNRPRLSDTFAFMHDSFAPTQERKLNRLGKSLSRNLSPTSLNRLDFSVLKSLKQA